MAMIKEIVTQDLGIDRTPPYSYEAEAAVLGAMLLEKQAIDKVLHYLDESCFYRDAHRLIFKAVIDLFERGEVVDLVTLREELKKGDLLERVGGPYYVAEILDVVPTAANVEYHSKIVLEKAILRKLINTATQIASESYESSGDVDDLLDRAEQMVFQISQDRLKQGFIHLRKTLHSTFELIEALHQKKEHITGVPSGFSDLDKLTAGFQKSDLIIVAGRPSMGKTSLCLNIAQYAAIEKKIPVAIFSLEMSKEQLTQRLLCSEARVDNSRLRTGRLKDIDWKRLTTAAGFLNDAPIYLDDTPAIGILEMRAKSRRLKSEVNLGLIIVDYLQLVQGPKYSESRQQEISMISRSLKALAKELDMPIMALSQLSRAVEVRGGDRRPQLSDLRESGAIEQDSDVVIFLYRPEFYGILDRDGNPQEGIAEVIVGKHRNGPTGTLNLYFNKSYTRFDDFSPRPEFN